MAANDNPAPESGRSVGAELDQLCDKFESQWKGRHRPDIAPLLLQIDESLREKLFTELLHLELEYRRQLGERPAIDAYLGDFAEFTDVIKAAFAASELRSADPHRGTVDVDSPKDDEVLKTVSTEESAPDGSQESPPTMNFEVREEEISHDREEPKSTDKRPSKHRFHVIRPHAKGGLGEVLLAFDSELNREVALKQIRGPYADQTDSRQRFMLEAEVTGGLEHPGIVPVYSLGLYADGRPYYAMRFIHGVSLRQAIKRLHKETPEGERDFELRKLIKRFIDVCNAIDYSHARGILHRDLKPDNIMLGEYGETLVVDWGLAKPVDVDVDPIRRTSKPLALSHASGVLATQVGSTVGTPQYMSPEQAAGQLDILGAPSDIYSLGATLYCLLTERPPFEKGDLSEILDRVQRGDFPKPRALNPALAKPLEACCLKAMKKHPQERYPSARALAEDLERWLADEPVTVYRETLRERSWRWLRKHRSWAMSGAAMLVIVAIVMTIATIRITRAEKQTEVHRGEAVRRLGQARDAVDTWLTGASDVLESFPDTQLVRQRLLEQAATRYATFAKESSTDPEVELERAHTMLRLGDVRKLLVDYPQAEQAYRDAQSLVDQLVVAHPSAPYKLVQASAYVRLGILQADEGKLDEAEQQFATALTSMQSVTGDSAQQLRRDRMLSSIYINQALTRADLGEWAKAETLTRQSVDVLTVAVGKAGDDAALRVELANAQRALANTLIELGKLDDAIKLLEDAVAEIELAVVRAPDRPDYREASAVCQNTLASLHERLGQQDLRVKAFEQSLADYKALIKALPDVPRYRESVAFTQTNLAQVHQAQRRNLAAEPVIAQALQTYQEFVADRPQMPSYQEGLAMTLDVRGQLLRDLAKLDEAQKSFSLGIAHATDLAERFPEETLYRQRKAIIQSHLAGVLGHAKDQKESERLFNESLATLTELRKAAPDAIDIVVTLAHVQTQRAWLLSLEKQPAEARTAFQAAIETWQSLAKLKTGADDQSRLAWLLAVCPERDLRDARQALEIAQGLSQQFPKNADFKLIVAAAFCELKQFDDAARAMQEVVNLRGQVDGRDLLWQARLAEGAKQHDRAVELLHDAKAWIDTNCPGNVEMQVLHAETASIVGGN